MIVLLPGFQLAGQTTPFLSEYWNAWTSLQVSSTLRPTCSSLIVMDLMIPFPSMITSPRREAPSRGSSGSSTRTPYSAEISFVMSETKGIEISPSPPSFLAVFLQAKCEKWESTEIAKTSVLILAKSAALEEQLMIQVGQTQVKSKGQKRRTTYLPAQSLRLTVLKLKSGITAWAVKSKALFLGMIAVAERTRIETTRMVLNIGYLYNLKIISEYKHYSQSLILFPALNLSLTDFNLVFSRWVFP